MSERRKALDAMEREHTVYGNPTTNRRVRALIAVAREATLNTRCWVDFAAGDEEIPTNLLGDCPGCALLVALADLDATLGVQP